VLDAEHFADSTLYAKDPVAPPNGRE
jgi:hypothetical protein